MNYATEVMALDNFVRREIVLSSLYKVYLQKFPDYSDFWKRLAEDQDLHIKWVRELAEQKLGEELAMNEDRLKLWLSLKASIEHIEKQIDLALEGELSLYEALSVLLYIEKEAVEKLYFQILKNDSAIVKEILNNLDRDVQDHVERISKAWMDNKPKA